MAFIILLSYEMKAASAIQCRYIYQFTARLQISKIIKRWKILIINSYSYATSFISHLNFTLFHIDINDAICLTF